MDVIDNSQLKSEVLIEKVVKLCGEGSILACVPMYWNVFELTLDGNAPAQILLDGIEIKDRIYECRKVINDIKVVSFLHLPAYVEDDEIIEKVTEFGAHVVRT